MESNYQIVKIQQYLQGQLTPKEMFEMEREALEDPFLADAIEGYRKQGDVEYGRLSFLQRRLAERIEQQREEKSRFFFGGQRLGIAATACVLFMLGILLFWLRTSYIPSSNTTAGEAAEKQVEVVLPPPSDGLSGITSSEGVDEALPRGTIPSHVNEVGLSISTLSTATSNQLMPVEGWDAFHRYLEKELSWEVVSLSEFPEFGTSLNVTVDIDQRGQLSAIKVDTVTTSGRVSKNIQEELKRVLEVGPRWKGNQGILQVEFVKAPISENK